MITSNSNQPTSIVLSTLISGVIGVCSVYGGTALIADPTGDTLALPIGLISNIVLSNYMPMGVFMLLLGLCFVASALSLWRNRSWAWPLTITIDVILLLWIALALIFTGHLGIHQVVLAGIVIWQIHLLFRKKAIKYTISD